MSDSRPARATLARGPGDLGVVPTRVGQLGRIGLHRLARVVLLRTGGGGGAAHLRRLERGPLAAGGPHLAQRTDRKSTRLNSSHVASSYAVFCLDKKIVRGPAAHADV